MHNKRRSKETNFIDKRMVVEMFSEKPTPVYTPKRQFKKGKK